MTAYLTSSSFAFIGAFVLVSLLLGAGTDWVRRRQVRDRPKVPATEGDETLNTRNDHTVRRVLEVLADYLRVDAETIQPHDRLDDDLDLDVAANPDLFFALERAFGIDCHVDKFEVIEATTAGLDTVGDVIDFIVEKVDEARTKPAPPKRSEPRIAGIEIIAISWFLGIAVMIVGALMQNQRIMTGGLVLAFLPLTFGLGRVLLHVFRDLAQGVREVGAGEVLKHPVAMLGWALVTSLMLAAFAAFCHLLLKAFSVA